MGELVAGHVCHEGMGHAFHPVVPVLVHEIVDDAARCLRQIGISVGSRLAGLHLLDEEHLFAVGREGEPFNVFLQMGYLRHAAPIGVDAPYLGAARLVAQEGDLLAAVDPLRVALLRVGDGELFFSGAVDVHDKQLSVGFILRDAHVGDRIDEPVPVGRERGASHPAEAIEHFGRHDATTDVGCGLADDFVRFFAILRTFSLLSRLIAG